MERSQCEFFLDMSWFESLRTATSTESQLIYKPCFGNETRAVYKFGVINKKENRFEEILKLFTFARSESLRIEI